MGFLITLRPRSALLLFIPSSSVAFFPTADIKRQLQQHHSEGELPFFPCNKEAKINSMKGGNVCESPYGQCEITPSRLFASSLSFPPLLSPPPPRALADEYWKEKEGRRKKRTPNLESREKRKEGDHKRDRNGLIRERERERLVAPPVAAFSPSLAGSRPAIFLYLVVSPPLFASLIQRRNLKRRRRYKGERKEKEPTLPTNASPAAKANTLLFPIAHSRQNIESYPQRDFFLSSLFY